MFPKTVSLFPILVYFPHPDHSTLPRKEYSMIDMNYDDFIYLLGSLLADVLPAEKIVHLCQVVGVLGDRVGGAGRSVITLSMNNMTEVTHLQAQLVINSIIYIRLEGINIHHRTPAAQRPSLSRVSPTN